MNLTGNTILITGGATGIGLALAESLSALENTVIICGRREDRLLEARAKNPKLYTRVCDVSDRSQQRLLYEWVTSEFPEINMLINNAGIQRDLDLTKGIDEIIEGDNEILINLEAPIILSSLFIPYLGKQDKAAIVNVSSGLAFTPMPRMPVYCATKAALHTYTLTLRQQLSNTTIKVFEVIPPMVDTELNMKGRAERKMQYRGVNSKEYATAVIKGLKNDEFEIYYGQTENARTAPRAELEKSLLSLE